MGGARLACGRPEKLPACWCVEEQRANRHRRSAAPNRIADAVEPAAVHAELGAAAFRLGGGEGEPGDRGDRRQRLTAKSEGRDANEIGDNRILLVAWRSRARTASSRAHAAAIVADLNQRLAAVLDLDSHAVAPASSAFSTSSFTTDAGRSTTSPAAIWSATASGRMAMRLDMGRI